MARISLLSLFFLHLVWNVLGILLRYSGAVVWRICKIHLYRSPFLTKVQIDWKRNSDTVFFTNNSGRLLWISFIFFLAVLYTHSRNFSFKFFAYFSNNWALFAVNFWFLNHEAKACWWVQQQNETAIILTKSSCKR